MKAGFRTIQLVIASRNVHKIREIRAILQHLPFLDILSLSDFPSYQPPPEKGASFKENAIVKACHAAKILNHLALGDDSGLIVPVLNGEPGIFSSRYAGDEATDAENRKKLLEKMGSFVDEERSAFYESCLALASPEKLIKSACATCEGSILIKEKGGGGFGYDSLFVKNEYNKSFAELEEFTKNRISHRRKALDKLIPTLISLSRVQ